MSYRNPIIPGFNPDPSIVRIGKDYFLVTSTFEYFPGLPVYKSRDLINWELIGHACNRPSQLNMRTVRPGGGLYAPCIRFIRGRVYVTCASVYGDIPSRGFCVWTDDILDETKWRDPILFDSIGIDQDLFWDQKTDKVYLSTTKGIQGKPGFNSGVYVCEIDLDTGRNLTPSKLIRSTNIGRGYSEGSHIFRKDDYLYLITAEGGTEAEHQEWICRTKEGPFGPWDVGPSSVNPLVFNDKDPEVQHTGHMDMVEGPDGQWWAVLLATRPQSIQGESKLSQLGRETFLCPVEWKDGWPVVNQHKPVGINGIQCGLPRSKAKVEEKFNFDPSKPLDKSWYHLRTPMKHEYDLTSRPGSLALHGGPYGITQDECPTMLLQKQPSFDAVWRCTIDFDPKTRHEAGTALWWSKYAYASIGIRPSGDRKREVILRRPNPNDDTFLEDIHPLEAGPVTFQITATPAGYSFAYQQGSGKMKSAGDVPSTSIVRTRPFDSIFTGSHFALYVTGDEGWACLQPAYFSDGSMSCTLAGGD